MKDQHKIRLFIQHLFDFTHCSGISLVALKQVNISWVITGKAP